jgi:IclR family transcriptional regulator, KDG regulon repressor
MERPLTSVDRALDILEAFERVRPEMALGEIALKLGMSKSTVHKLLQTLAARGYIAQDPETRRYRLGLSNWNRGTLAVGALDVRRVAAPHLRAMAADTGEQLMLWVLEDGYAVAVDRVDSVHPVRAYTRLGAIERPEDLSAGRCLLAYAGEPEVERALARVAAAHGPAEVELLRERLDGVRAHEYDVYTGERWPEARALSTPIRDDRAEVVAALTVSSTATRFTAAARAAMLPRLLATGRRISAELGCPDERLDRGAAHA